MVESSSAATGGIKGMMTKAHWSSRREKRKRRRRSGRRRKRKRGAKVAERSLLKNARDCSGGPEPQTFRSLLFFSPLVSPSPFEKASRRRRPASMYREKFRLCSLLRANRAGLTVSRVVRGVGENFLATSFHVSGGGGGWNRDGECSVSVELTRPTIFR